MDLLSILFLRFKSMTAKNNARAEKLSILFLRFEGAEVDFEAFKVVKVFQFSF